MMEMYILRQAVIDKMALLKKNKEVVVKNGRVQKQYAKAYKNMWESVCALLDEYAFRVVTGDWWIGDTEEERAAFIEAYKKLLEKNEALESHSSNGYRKNRRISRTLK